MWLERLRVRNYRCFRNVDVAFPETGVVLITGRNNAGKSALLKAQELAAVWTAVEQELDAEWEEHWKHIAPGEEMLTQLFRKHDGPAYQKTKHAAALAAAVEPPPELRGLVARLCAGPEEGK